MINFLFNALFFVIPLVFYKNTSELFEFNKIIILYSFTVLILGSWIIESIKQRKFLFRKTILDWPLISYLVILLISSLVSIDPRTSWLGYYSRFNGGLVSQLCYAILYWAFVSNINKKQSLYTIYYILASTALASILAILEHFGIFATCSLMGFGYKDSCWVQDVQNRVFSTLGQPNWLAALLVASIPFTWRKNWKYYLISILFFITLLFTKSRSGFLAFGIEVIIFWGLVFWQSKFKYLKHFAVQLLVFGLLSFAILFKPTANSQQQMAAAGPVLETGGTESGTIRKYVWLGAINVFKHYPILGTGPETFAFSFPMFKPALHNLTSEWDFIYNKAHNEFLNHLANTGLVGFISYTFLIIYTIIIFWKIKRFDYLSGYIAILVTDFFGFSIVPVSLLFYLFPAIAFVQSTESKIHLNNTRLKVTEKLVIFLVFFGMCFSLANIYRYWQADINYNKAKGLNRSNKPEAAIVEINKALKFSPNESIFKSELALSNGKVETAFDALSNSPFNQNIRKIFISNLVKNAGEIPDNLLVAEKVITDGLEKSPNDPRLYYQLGVLQLKIGKNDEAIKNLSKSIELKSNYKEGHFALGMTYKALKQNEDAKLQFEYILKNIDPNDELTKKNLEELKALKNIKY